MLWSHREFSPKSPKSHTPLGLRAFQPRSLLVVGDVKSLIPASFPAAAPSSWLTSVPRAAGGAAGSLGAEAATAKIKQRETSHFFVSAPASGKWQRTGGRQTKQGVPGQKKKKSPPHLRGISLLSFPPSQASFPPHPGCSIENLPSD